MVKRDWHVFWAAVFFVLGFSSVFSLMGVLLQSILANVSYTIQLWLGRVGGVLIIAFGLHLLGLINPSFLAQEKKIQVKKTFGSIYLTSFLFGAAFAVGWTPCVGPILGAILTLAVTQPASAFFLMFAYSLGLGLPFLVVGLFAQQSQNMIRNAGPWLEWFRRIFGVVLIALGILVFTGQLARVANVEIATEFLAGLGLESISFGSTLNIGIAFLAGFLSFLSPCVLPLIPAFLSYLASVVTVNGKKS